MPEYLAPGVFVEEVSFRSKSIEGVPTSHDRLRRPDPVRAGPVPAAVRGPTEPRLVTSFTEFERVYGGSTGSTPAPAAASRSWRTRPGRTSSTAASRLYVSRVFGPGARAAASPRPR